MEMIELQIQIFLLAVVGFVLGKKGVLNTETRDHLVDVILMVVLPCSILQSFEMELSPDILISTLNVFLISCGIQFFYWVWNRFFYKNAEEDKKICLKYATMVSNAGFIGMPVASAVYGSLGLLYASVFLLPQRVFMWSYGLSMFTTVSSREVVKKGAHPSLHHRRVSGACHYGRLHRGDLPAVAFKRHHRADRRVQHGSEHDAYRGDFKRCGAQGDAE